MDYQIQARLKWVTLYIKIKDAGLVCNRCGISRPTLRKWYRRFKADGLKGLEDQSRRPLNSPNKKINNSILSIIKNMCKSRNLGARRI